MKRYLAKWVESYFYEPSIFQKFLSFFLIPFTFIYCAVVILKRVFCKKRDFKIPVISVGNLIVGGSGKTPLVIKLANRFDGVAIILRGYNREKDGLLVVSQNGKILVDVNSSGDEAMLIAKKAPKATVLVSKDRIKAIKKAKELNAKVVFLDDAFHRCNIKKFDILIDVETKNRFCLPSGPYREPFWFKRYANLVVKEGVDFKREVKIKNPTKNMVLVSAIARAKRLEKYVDKSIKKYFFEDHHRFTKKEIEEIIKKEKATSILVTQKDEVKLSDFGFNLSIMELDLDIDEKIYEKIDKYLRKCNEKEDSNSSDTP